jgi:hypothetical protein
MIPSVKFLVALLVSSVTLQCVQAEDISVHSRKAGHSRKSITPWSITLINNTKGKARVDYEITNAITSPKGQGRSASGTIALDALAAREISPVYTRRGARPQVAWHMTVQEKRSLPALLVDLDKLSRRKSPGTSLGKPKELRPSGFDGAWEGTLSIVLNGLSKTERIRVEIAGDKVNVTNLDLGGSVQQTVVNRSENSLVLRRNQRGAQKTTRMMLSADSKRLFLNYWSESSPGQARGVLRRS